MVNPVSADSEMKVNVGTYDTTAALKNKSKSFNLTLYLTTYIKM